jgi:hypothetical protein
LLPSDLVPDFLLTSDGILDSFESALVFLLFGLDACLQVVKVRLMDGVQLHCAVLPWLVLSQTRHFLC